MSIARAGVSESAPIEVLEAHGERVEPAAAGKTGDGNSEIATVGTVHGTADRER